MFLVLLNEDDQRYYFKKTEVKIGEANAKYTEIKSPPLQDKILTKGAYFINLEE